MVLKDTPFPGAWTRSTDLQSALEELLPEGSQIKYRKGAFEAPPEETSLPQKTTLVAKVMNLNTGKLMFSKLQTGVSPVYEERSVSRAADIHAHASASSESRGGADQEFDYFAKKVMATIP